MSIRVLLVDDSAMARRSTRRILESAGYDVVEADDGLAALERFAIDKPDVVLLDLVMKGMYGLDVLAKLVELDPAVRVLVMSADVQTSSRDLVKDAGAAGFINKPAGHGEIVDAVSRIAGGGTSWN